MEFTDKIMLHCFREVKCEQGCTTRIWYWLYNALVSTTSMCSNGLMVSKTEFRYDNPGLLPRRGGYKFTFQFF